MKLSKEEFEKKLKQLRLLNPDFRNQIAPLVHYCQWLIKENKRLEDKFQSDKQVDLLNATPEKGLRLWLMFNKGLTKELDTWCRFNKKSRKEALVMANEFAQRSGYKQIQE